jgi:Ca2+/Na+ antiporter
VKRITDLLILPMLRMRGDILFLIFVLFYVFFVLFYAFLCCSMYCLFCVLCIVCIYALNYCHRVDTQLQLNIYHISYHIIPLVHHKRSCKILGSHSGNYEDSRLSVCDTMTSDTQTFWGNLLLKMEGQGSSANSVRLYQPTRRHIPEDGRPNLQTKLKKILH